MGQVDTTAVQPRRHQVLTASTRELLGIEDEIADRVLALAPDQKPLQPGARRPMDVVERFPWLHGRAGIVDSDMQQPVNLHTVGKSSTLPGVVTDLHAVNDVVAAAELATRSPRWAEITSGLARDVPALSPELTADRRAVAGILIAAADFLERSTATVTTGVRSDESVRAAVNGARGVDPERYAYGARRIVDKLRGHAGGLDVGYEDLAGRLLGTSSSGAKTTSYTAIADSLIGASTWLVADEPLLKVYSLPKAPTGWGILEGTRRFGRRMLGHV